MVHWCIFPYMFKYTQVESTKFVSLQRPFWRLKKYLLMLMTQWSQITLIIDKTQRLVLHLGSVKFRLKAIKRSNQKKIFWNNLDMRILHKLHLPGKCGGRTNTPIQFEECCKLHAKKKIQ